MIIFWDYVYNAFAVISIVAIAIAIYKIYIVSRHDKRGISREL
jgi:hypothetical protein